MPSRGVRATLSLHFRNEANEVASVLDVRTQEPPLRVVRAFTAPDGAALVHLHNLSGGVLGGDQLGLTLQVGVNAKAQVTSTGSTRIYRHRSGEADAKQQTQITVASGGLLEYLPDTLIPYAGSRYHQQTKIELGEDAGLFYWELITPGRAARDELFQYELLRLDLDLSAANRPLAIERMRLEPAQQSLSSLLQLGQYRYFTTFYICKTGLPASRWLALEDNLAETAHSHSKPDQVLWGVSALTAHGLVVRGLAMTSRILQSGLVSFWQQAKRELYEAEAIMPRKVY